MDNNSFSLQFNPMQKIKSIKDYETELKNLKNENFELKHQMAFYKSASQKKGFDENIQKLLYDSKRSIDILEMENRNLNKQLENLREIIRSNSLDKENLKNEYSLKITELEDKILMFEEENSRLTSHIETMKEANNRLISENKNFKESTENFKKVIDEQKEYINTLETERDNVYKEGENIMAQNNSLSAQNKNYLEEGKKIYNENLIIKEENDKLKKELEKIRKENKTILDDCNNYKNELNDLSNKIQNVFKEKENQNVDMANLRRDYENKISGLKNLINEYEGILKQKNSEIEKIKEFYQNKTDTEENLYVKELKENYTRETKEKQELAIKNIKVFEENKLMKEKISDLMRKLEVFENENRALKYQNDSKENRINSNNEYKIKYEKLSKEVLEFQKLVNCQINTVERTINNIENRVKKLIDSNGFLLSDENKEFLSRFKVKKFDPNEIANIFKRVFTKLNNRINLLENEVKDISLLAKNNPQKSNKITEFITKFYDEFKSARKEIDVCKEYLEKKSKEIKELKKEKCKLEGKYNLVNNELKKSKNNENILKESYQKILNKFKIKDDLISKPDLLIGGKMVN